MHMSAGIFDLFFPITKLTSKAIRSTGETKSVVDFVLAACQLVLAQVHVSSSRGIICEIELNCASVSLGILLKHCTMHFPWTTKAHWKRGNW